MKTPPITGVGKSAFAFVMLLSLGVLAAPLAQAQTFSVIHNFTGGSDGANPLSGFLMVDGSFIGASSAGGSAGLGVVFKMSATGEETVLHEFTGGTDGANPEGHLVKDKQGNFYGTTWAGGSSNAGTVFKITGKGVETVLFSFPSYGDGASPVAGLAIDTAGNLYLTGHGVTVFDSAGKQIDHIDVPEKWTANVCFSGPERKTLFITASTNFYSIRLIHAGGNPAK